MLTRNLTSFLFGAKVTSRLPPKPEMAMIVRGTFTLRPGEPVAPVEGLLGGLLEQRPLTSDVFAEDDDDRVGACSYPSDLADYKPHAEVFLVGSCSPPAGQPVRECGVRFAVGAWSKSLFVIGRRTWGALGPSAPEPFEKMPIGWTNSFGGPKYEKNPSGKGLGTDELPNVESPAGRVTGKSDRPDPAGFGPISPWWPQRAGKMSKSMFGKNGFVDDIDWSRFNAAPADQQLKTFLQGDEELTLQNLHAAAAVFTTRLPALRIRAFAKDNEGIIREARMNLDTLLVDTDKEQLILTWRGHVPCKEMDLTDVKTVLVASEKLASAPLSLEHYTPILEAFHADAVGVLADEAMPGGRKKRAALQAIAKDRADHPERSHIEHAIAILDNEDLMTMGVPDEHRADALKTARESKEKLKETAAKEREMAAAVAGGAKPPKTANELAEEAPDRHAELSAALKKLRADAETAGAPLTDIEKLEKTIDDPVTKKMLLGSPRAAELGPGKDLSGRIMMDRDLSGLNLSGANLQGAILTGARLVGTCLKGANLHEALLQGTDLTGADLSDAILTRAFLTNAKAPRADFRGATLDGSAVSGVDLKEANFTGAKFHMGILSRSNLTKASLVGADFLLVSADEVVLEGADFSDAKLVKCSFMRCRASGATFKNVVLTNTSFMDGDLRKANFVAASGEQTNFIKANLEGADFRFAVLQAAHFMEAQAVGTIFYGADLKGSEFVRACLDRALFRKANLFGANLDKAALNGTSFLDASLYEANFGGAHGKDTIFVGANTKKATLPS